MAGRQIPAGYGQAAFLLVAGEGTAPFITTIGITVTDTTGSLATVANDLFGAYAVNILPHTWQDFVLNQVLVSEGTTSGGISASSSTAPVPGTKGGTGLPVNLAIIAQKITGSGGRKNRGRMFLPGTAMQDTVTTSGTVTPGAVAALGDGLTAFLNDMGDYNPVVLHADGSNPTAITAFRISRLVGTVRARIS